MPNQLTVDAPVPPEVCEINGNPVMCYVSGNASPSDPDHFMGVWVKNINPDDDPVDDFARLLVVLDGLTVAVDVATGVWKVKGELVGGVAVGLNPYDIENHPNGQSNRLVAGAIFLDPFDYQVAVQDWLVSNVNACPVKAPVAAGALVRSAPSVTTDVYPFAVQDGWLLYSLFESSSISGHRLMTCSCCGASKPLHAGQIAVAATNVNWRPAPGRVLVTQPQGLLDFGGTDPASPPRIRSLRFPELPKFALVIHQFAVSDRTVVTSQCQGSPQAVELARTKDVLVQLNASMSTLLANDITGNVTLAVKVVA